MLRLDFARSRKRKKNGTKRRIFDAFFRFLFFAEYAQYANTVLPSLIISSVWSALGKEIQVDISLHAPSDGL